ncbi:MAG: DUF5020 family protein [Candidatus Marinimicrobia bacterium]|nr:DUF5020 family protein [Candidatus Neomarinimicrobiota bacterium]
MIFKSLLFLILFAGTVFCQNLQLQYELDSDRHHLVSTLEMFKPDDYGSTFWFIDFEYNDTGNKSVSLAYFEIARYVNLPFSNIFQGTVQYNDGLTTSFGGLGQVWLTGISKQLNLPGLPITVDILYRQQVGFDSPDIQFTSVWYKPLLNEKLIFTGFVDIWSADNSAADGKDWVVFSEPQIWYAFSKNASIGGEAHIQYNFPMKNDTWELFPTVGLKWDF